MSFINVWAFASDIPTIVCADARLKDRERWYVFTMKNANEDKVYGQYGWHIGIKFNDLDNLLLQLKSIQIPDDLGGGILEKGRLNKLAINMHGAPGVAFVNGQTDYNDALTVENIAGKYHQVLSEIGLYTPNNGSCFIYLMGCIVASGEPGSQLLIALSNIWPSRQVVGFTTIGYQEAGAMMRPSDACSEPGMRDTDSPFGFSPEAEKKYARQWVDLKSLPWASESSPHAKIAFNGKIIRG